MAHEFGARCLPIPYSRNGSISRSVHSHGRQTGSPGRPELALHGWRVPRSAGGETPAPAGPSQLGARWAGRSLAGQVVPQRPRSLDELAAQSATTLW